MKKYLIITLYALTLFIGSVGYAQTTELVTGKYTTLAPLPGTTNEPGCTENCTADINSYLSGFLGLVISIGAILAMVYLGIYGFQYAVSDSAPKKSEYKDKIWEILQGLLLILSAYAIIYTINPKFVTNISIELTSPKSKVFTPTESTGGSTSGSGTLTPSDNPARGQYMTNGVYYNACSNCTTLSSLGVSGSGSIDGSFGQELKNLQSSFPGFRVTEAWPPTVNHGQGCHKDGTCVDAVLSGGYSANNIIAFATAAKNAGARAVFEVSNQTEALRIKAALRDAGLPDTWAQYLPQCPPNTLTPGGNCITGTHFSVYNN